MTAGADGGGPLDPLADGVHSSEDGSRCARQRLTVIMLSGFGFWRPGGTWNNMILEYVCGFARAGHNVVLVGHEVRGAHPCPAEVAASVRFVRMRRLPVPALITRMARRRTVPLPPEANGRPATTRISDALERVLGPKTGIRGVMALARYTVDALLTICDDRRIRSARSELVLYGIDPHGAFAGRAAALLLRRPNVTRLMGSWLYFALERHGRIGTLYRHPDLYLGAAARSSLTVATNDGTHVDRMLSMLGRDPNRLLVLLNGIPDGMLTRVRQPFEHPTFVTVSRLVVWKRVDVVIEAFALAIEKIGESGRLIVVGGGPEELRLHALARELGVEAHVTFVSRIDHARALELIAQAWAVVSAYDFTNLTNQVLEALASGTPVITLRDGSTAEILRDGENSLLVDTYDPVPAMGSAMQRLGTDRTLMERLSGAARETALRHLQTWESRMEIEVRMVEELTARHTRRREKTTVLNPRAHPVASVRCR